MNKIRILYITDGLREGGKERQLIELLKYFKSENSNIQIGLISFNDKQHYTEIAKQLTFYFRIIKKNNKITPFYKTYSAIKEFNPDIIHTWDLISDIYAYPTIKIKSIKYVNGSIRDAGIEKGWQRKLKIFFLKQAKLIVSNSKAGLIAYHVEGEVIYNAINTNRFINTNEERAFNVIMVASFSDYKDYLTFCKATIELKSEKIIDKIYLVGSGKNLYNIQNYISNEIPEYKNDFIFTGTINNVEDYLAKCKIGILCSTTKYSEGLSNSVLEYMASGLVPIACKLGGNEEIINNNENGFLVEAENSTAIVEKVKYLFKNNEVLVKMSQKAKETIETKFNYLINAERLKNIYINTINNKLN